MTKKITSYRYPLRIHGTSDSALVFLDIEKVKANSNISKQVKKQLDHINQEYCPDLNIPGPLSLDKTNGWIDVTSDNIKTHNSDGLYECAGRSPKEGPAFIIDDYIDERFMIAYSAENGGFLPLDIEHKGPERFFLKSATALKEGAPDTYEMHLAVQMPGMLLKYFTAVRSDLDTPSVWHIKTANDQQDLELSRETLQALSKKAGQLIGPHVPWQAGKFPRTWNAPRLSN